MGEGQPRYSTEISDEYRYKYRPKIPRTPGLFYGDDREVVFKTMKAVTYGAITGTTSAAFMITRETPMTNIPYKAFRYGLPHVFVGASYGVTAGLLAKVRGKSDGLNHLCAGLVSGQILGSFYKSVTMGRWYSVIFATFGFFLKEFADHDSLITDIDFPSRPLNFSRLSLFIERPDHEGIKDSS